VNREMHHQQIVDFCLYGCSIDYINHCIADHPGLAEQDDYLDQFYILPADHLAHITPPED
jgi:hypothetical protein